MQSLGIIGHGDFGRFLETLAKRYLPGVAVRVHARKATPDGVRFFSLEEACQSDIVVIAVSIRAFEEMLLKLLPLLGPRSILIDVNTVKMHPAQLLRRHAGNRVWAATHPMFGPYSFEKQGSALQDLRLVIADHTLPDAVMARHLAVRRQDPLLLRCHIVFDAGGRPVEFAEVHYVSARFTLSIEMRREAK